MMSTEDWVRAPRQARSQATLERFVDATQLLLEERSFDDITVSDIVRTAERTVGSFYARFEDKYAVLFVIVQRMYERIEHLSRAFCDPVRWEDATLAEWVAEAVRLNVVAYRRAGPLFRASLHACATDERFRRARLEMLQLCAETQKAFVLTRRHEMAAADPERASDHMFETVSATLDHELLFGRFTTTQVGTDAELQAELVDRCLHILRVLPSDGMASTA